MTKLLYLPAALIAAVAAYVSQSPDLLLAVVVIVAAFSYCFYRDVVHASQRLARSLQHEGLGLASGARPYTPSSTVGIELVAGVEALQYRVHSLTSNLEAESFLRGLGEEDTIEDMPMTRFIDDSIGLDESVLYQMILDYIARKFSCTACSIVFRPLEPGSKPEVVSRGVKGERFDSHMLHLLGQYFRYGNENCFGFRDSLNTELLAADFGSFGLRYTVCQPIRWKEETTQRDGVLWLGYSNDVPPRERELELVEEVGRKIERELEAHRRMFELSGRAERAETTSKAKSEFIAHMSHDIRSPLNNIKSILNLFRIEGYTDDSDQMIDVALNNCESMAEIVEDILDYSRFSAGKLTAQKEIIDLGRCVDTVLEGFMVTARLKGLSLRRRPSEESTKIVADKRHVKRVISNLVSNAIKYTEQGSIDVSLDRTSPHRWSFRIKDTGVGMAPEQVDVLFTPFTRFHGSEIEGIGLGLTLTKILVELNGGAVHVTSQQGHGSEFSVSFPVAVAQGDEPPAPEPPQPDGNGGGPGNGHQPLSKTVLVVDDDVDCVDTLARGLERHGFRALKAVSVKEALQIVNFEAPDLIVTDGRMPDGGGRRLLEEVRGSARPIPVFIVSGRDSLEEKQEFFELGAQGVFSKPVELDELLTALRGGQTAATSAPTSTQKQVANG